MARIVHFDISGDKPEQRDSLAQRSQRDEHRIVVAGPDSHESAANHFSMEIFEFLRKEYVVDGRKEVDTAIEMKCTASCSGHSEPRSSEYNNGRKKLR